MYIFQFHVCHLIIYNQQIRRIHTSYIQKCPLEMLFMIVVLNKCLHLNKLLNAVMLKPLKSLIMF